MCPATATHKQLISIRWSGGFDIKAVVEIRPNSLGVNVALEEEQLEGIGAMFRVENKSPFPIWIGQDGVLANPSLAMDPTTLEQAEARRHHNQLLTCQIGRQR